MKRTVTLFKPEFVNSPDAPGDEDAVSRGLALGNTLDDKTLTTLLRVFMSMDFIGGQAYIQARRYKFDPDMNRIPDEMVDEVDGEWMTVGYVIRYDSRDLRVSDTDAGREAKAPDEVEMMWPEEEASEPVLEAAPEPVEEPAAA